MCNRTSSIQSTRHSFKSRRCSRRRRLLQPLLLGLALGLLDLFLSGQRSGVRSKSLPGKTQSSSSSEKVGNHVPPGHTLILLRQTGSDASHSLGAAAAHCRARTGLQRRAGGASECTARRQGCCNRCGGSGHSCALNELLKRDKQARKSEDRLENAAVEED
ncbi:hypothetical protein Mapa_003419 [Marchantia paleacea]|nr:hypothetical protein Mapa_003419 [Marchantia paleacea]